MAKLQKNPLQFDLSEKFSLEEHIELKKTIENLILRVSGNPKDGASLAEMEPILFFSYLLSDHIYKLTGLKAPIRLFFL